MDFITKAFAAAIVTGCLALPATLYADCVDGSRPTTEAERQTYNTTMAAIKAALPTPPADWQVQAPNPLPAPNSVCKGSRAVAGYDAVYFSSVLQKQNQERQQKVDAEIRTLQQLPADKQKEADDLYKQGSQLGYQSIAAQKNKNPDEAARLRAEANKYYAQSKAIKQEHLQSISPQINKLLADNQAVYVSPEVRAHIVAVEGANPAKGERVSVPGADAAYFDSYNNLNLSFGKGVGQAVSVQLRGSREPVLAIANLFAGSSLKTLAVK